MPNILPTHQCFDDAIALIEERIREDADKALELRIVHGIAVAQDGTPYAHGWVEEDGLCWDAGLLDGQRIYYAVARDQYISVRSIVASTRYTLTQAWAEISRTQHHGPWKPEYLALTGSSRRVMGKIELRHG